MSQQGTAPTLREELEAEIERLEAHFAKLNRQDVETNRRLREALEEIASDSTEAFNPLREIARKALG